MAYAAHRHSGRGKRRSGHGPLWAPILLFAAVTIAAAAYVSYVLWPRWPDAPVARNAPSLPIMVAGVEFNIEPAAIRNAIQRRPGRQPRADLVYLWPSLAPPDPAARPSIGKPVASDLAQRLFVTIQASDGTLSPAERLRDIYPRYLAPEPGAGPPGLTLQKFRDDSPYRGEELAVEPQSPTHFLARCALHGVSGDGNCLLERRIGEADITVRFPRDWLNDWRGVADGIDRLVKRLHPG
jgi:hypothetical protein